MASYVLIVFLLEFQAALAAGTARNSLFSCPSARQSTCFYIVISLPPMSRRET